MLNYRTLENTGIETLHKAFNQAFSDYQIKTDIPLPKLQQMLQRRGYTPELSMGAFDGDALVGFILNGFRDLKGRPTIYDTGTGVIPEYRKQGITANIFGNLKDLLKDRGIKQYILEVLQSNAPAFKIYKNLGFEISRSFACFQLEKSNYKPISNHSVESINKINASDWAKLASLWDFEPSWQNSIASVNVVSDAFAYKIVYCDNAVAGYGIVDKKTGDIPQIAVDKHYRRMGIAGSIMTELLDQTEAQRVAVINVDGSSETTKGFLHGLGFENYVDQYEMVLEL